MRDMNWLLMCIIFISMIVFICMCCEFIITRNANKKTKEILDKYPKITFSKYKTEYVCGSCGKISRHKCCEECGEACNEIVGRWKIKDFGPPVIVDPAGVFCGTGPHHKEKIEFIKKPEEMCRI